MKKIVALVLALGMTACLFASCGDSDDTTTTTGTIETTTGESTSSTETSSTSSSTTETTTTKRTEPIQFADEDMIDSLSYGYYCKILRDENKEILGLAVCGWKNEYATANIVIDTEYTTRDIAGNPTTLPIIQVGVGQGIVNFQTKVETVVIPEGIVEIEYSAFSQCTNLKSVTLPEGLTTIGRMAFWNCKALESIVIPDTVTEIGQYAFANCLGLKSVTIPARFQSQVENIFSGCTDIVFTYTN